MKTETWHRVDDFTDIPFKNDDKANILDDPRLIYGFLKTKIYGQDEALISAAMLLYNHVHNRPQRAIYMGPTGSGKSEIFRTLKEIYPYIIIYNAASVSHTGLVGDDPNSCLREVKNTNKPYLICLDEFDKLCDSSVGQEENVQSEYLALIQASHPYVRIHGSSCEADRRIKIDEFSWVLIGSFATAVEEVAKGFQQTDGKPGKDNQLNVHSIYSGNIGFNELLRYGNLKAELAGRMTNLVKLNSLTCEDYLTLIKDFDNGPLKVTERMYGFSKGYLRKNIIGIKTIRQIAKEAYESGLGTRYAYGKIAALVDRYIFENFETFSKETAAS